MHNVRQYLSVRFSAILVVSVSHCAAKRPTKKFKRADPAMADNSISNNCLSRSLCVVQGKKWFRISRRCLIFRCTPRQEKVAHGLARPWIAYIFPNFPFFMPSRWKEMRPCVTCILATIAHKLRVIRWGEVMSPDWHHWRTYSSTSIDCLISARLTEWDKITELVVHWTPSSVRQTGKNNQFPIVACDNCQWHCPH